MRIEKGREEVIIYSYICDFCGNGTEHHRVCSICGRDLCSDCTKFDPRNIGDYPEKFCINCFQIGQKYIDQINIEQEKFDALIERLEQEWRDDAIKALEMTR